MGINVKRAIRHYRTMKAVRKKLGLTGGSRHFRQFKRSFRPGSVVSSSMPTSASTTYQYDTGRTLSRLTGGA